MEEYWRSFQSFPFTLLGTTLVFKWGWRPQESPGLRRSASSCWACFCWVHLRGLEIVCHCITQAIKKEEELSIAASKLEVRRLKEPLAVSLFRSRLLIAQWWICQLGCAGRQVGEGGCWCWDQPRHIDVHYLLLILCSPLSYFVIWHLILDKWHFCGLLAQMYDFKVWLLWLFAPRLAALSVVEIADALLVLLNLFDRACWTRPFVSACKEAGV